MQNDSNSTKHIITFKNVWKRYEENDLGLIDIDLAITKGDFVALIGPSGCGKSTLMKIVAGLEAPTEGVVEKPERVSLVFQNGALFPWLSVKDNVMVGARAIGGTEIDQRERTENAIAKLGLADFSEKTPRELSGGQRQRIGIARALASNPEVLLLDEPFSALDPKTTEELHRDISLLWQQTGATIIMVTHLIEEAVALANRIIIMKEFRIVGDYPVTMTHPRREDGATFGLEVRKIHKAFFAA